MTMSDEDALDEEAIAPHYRLLDYLEELLGLREVTVDPEFDATLKELRAHQDAVRGCLNAVTLQLGKLEAMVKAGVKLRAASAAMAPAAADALAPWAAAADAPSVDVSGPGGEVVADLKAELKRLKDLKVKCSRAREVRRSDMDHYQQKVASLERQVLRATEDGKRRAKRAEAESAKARKAGAPVPKTFHSWYEDPDETASKKLEALELKLARNAVKSKACDEAFASANAMATQALKTAAADSIAETKPVLEKILNLEAAILAQMTAPANALDAAAADVAKLTTPEPFSVRYKNITSNSGYTEDRPHAHDQDTDH